MHHAKTETAADGGSLQLATHDEVWRAHTQGVNTRCLSSVAGGDDDDDDDDRSLGLQRSFRDHSTNGIAVPARIAAKAFAEAEIVAAGKAVIESYFDDDGGPNDSGNGERVHCELMCVWRYCRCNAVVGPHCIEHKLEPQKMRCTAAPLPQKKSTAAPLPAWVTNAGKICGCSKCSSVDNLLLANKWTPTNMANVQLRLVVVGTEVAVVEYE